MNKNNKKISRSISMSYPLTVAISELSFVLFTCFLILVLWWLPKNNILLNLSYLFLVWISGSVCYCFSRVKFLVSLLSPNFICFYYLSLSICFGSLAAHFEYGRLLNDFISDFKNVSNLKFAITFLIFGLTVNLLIGGRFAKKLHGKDIVMPNSSSKQKFIFALITFIYLMSFIDSFFAYAVKLLLAITACLFMHKIKLMYRFFAYILIIFPFTMAFSNKREMILVLLVIFFSEAVGHRSKFKATLPTFIIGASMLILVFCFIMGLSLMRGYGGFEVHNFFNAITLIPKYISTDLFLHNIADNLEVSHTFPALVLPIDYIISGRLDLLAGSTLIKPFFIPFPSEIIWFKPDSALTVFTIEQAEHVYTAGGSFPVPFISEVFMNFHIFGIIIYLLIFYLFEKIYLRSITSFSYINKTFFVFLAFYSFVVIRGSGLDIYFLHSLVPFLLFCAFRFFWSSRQQQKKFL